MLNKIYVGHNTKFDYITELYNPLKQSKLSKEFKLIFPHENSLNYFNSKKALKTCKFMLAEVSTSTIGLGIELGWADLYDVKIICLYKKGSKISKSLEVVSSNFVEYENSKDLIEKLKKILK